MFVKFICNFKWFCITWTILCFFMAIIEEIWEIYILLLINRTLSILKLRHSSTLGSFSFRWKCKIRSSFCIGWLSFTKVNLNLLFRLYKFYDINWLGHESWITNFGNDSIKSLFGFDMIFPWLSMLEKSSPNFSWGLLIIGNRI